MKEEVISTDKIKLFMIEWLRSLKPEEIESIEVDYDSEIDPATRMILYNTTEVKFVVPRLCPPWDKFK